MIVTGYEIRDEMKGSADRKNVQACIEIKVVSSLEEYQRFMLALSDGAFIFKRISEEKE